ncbi:MobF family relaxase [Nocardioides sp. YIM 152588]|uniref:MobF family relaxase n=1 Tax=Nocardioides sp. YIM 152588 TaxID=3158259 RepID=UPI0032E42B2C
MHGGLKIYRGSAAAARHYVESDRSRADDYYLAEGSGLAERFVATPEGVGRAPSMDGDEYEHWVAGYDLETGAAKGRLRTDDQAVRFVEVTVNGPKTWSLAAALHPEIAAAHDAAQDRAARQIIAWIAQHATTRVGPRGRQVQVPVEQIEAAVVRHYTSRAGDPHRHLHLQVNARVFAQGRWRGIHTVGIRDSLEAINGIGHAAVMTDPEFRAALAAYGYHLDPESGEVAELAPYAGAFSARARQIVSNVDRYEAEWRADHPGEEPGPTLRRTWDRRAWSDARPDKVVPTSGADLATRWVEELRDLGFRAPRGPAPVAATKFASLEPNVVAAEVLERLGARRSAWNEADVRGEVERLVAAAGVVVEAPARRELAELLTAVTVSSSTRLMDRDDVPEHIRALSSPRVVGVEHDLVQRICGRADTDAARRAATARIESRLALGLDDDQRRAAAHLAGTFRLLVIEGAAGAGKTATLTAARAALLTRGSTVERDRRMVVVTPTRKASAVAAADTGAAAHPVAWLLRQHGYRWDDTGHWHRLDAQPGPEGRLRPGDLLVVDEAGMLDQDSARALLEVADEAGARLALVGDRHQLPAVGRGGVLDLAARYAPTLALDGVHRFADPAYAELSLQMRRGEDDAATFDRLHARGEIVTHADPIACAVALAREAMGGSLVVADTREQVAQINALVHECRVRTGEASDDLVTAAGERIGVGDRIATRRNDAAADVANREAWTVVDCDRGALAIEGERGRRELPAAYVREHVELAYATTAHGAQGSTVPTAHVLVGEPSGAASTYVGMTRGRDRNVAHLVADSVDDARRQWVEVFGRDRADLGPAHAARRAGEAMERYGSNVPKRPVPDPFDRPRLPASRDGRSPRAGQSIGF